MHEDKALDRQMLVRQALEARKSSYSPYSGFCVGAALLAEDGSVFLGCNVENAAYSVTNCAERTAFYKAVSEGQKHFRAIAIVGGDREKGALELCPPCGVCRQVMMEFCDPDEFEIILGTEDLQYKVYMLGEMLPMGFGPAQLH